MDIVLNIIQPSWREKLVKLLPQKRHLLNAAAVALTLLVLFYAYQLFDGYRNAKQIRGLVDELESGLLARDWEGVQGTLRGLAVNADELAGDLDRLFPLTLLPLLNSETTAVRNILAAAQINIEGANEVVGWLGQFKLLKGKSFESVGALPEDARREFLQGLANSGPVWDKVKYQTAVSLDLLEAAQQRTRLPILGSFVNSLTATLSSGQNFFNNFEPYIPLLPKLLGYPASQTYLLLLQNNTELRPTGGFIGTFGHLTLANGSVSSFGTENVYNLDEPAKDYNTKAPPAPIQRYLKQSQWFFRDVNWDPDFPSSAREAMRFYREERGPIASFNGVIALTPEIIKDVLKVTGPITIRDNVFTAENIVAKLQYEVDVAFEEKGVNIYNRKEIIDDLAQVLKEKIFAFGSRELRSLAPLLLEAFSEKQLMVYFTDSRLQELAAKFNWDNRVLETDGDYIYVVDANLGSLKTDLVVSRTISYKLEPENRDHSLQATMAITYNNDGDFDWKTTRYRTYARLYVPYGSTLISAKGNEETISISDEHGKTVFGTFISIEPGRSETLTFTYKLPAFLAAKAARGQYKLLAQKQAGAQAHALKLDIALPFKIGAVAPESILKKESTNQVVGDWDLGVDREVVLESN